MTTHRLTFMLVEFAAEMSNEEIAGEGVVVDGVECRRVRLDDGRIFSLQGGKVPHWQLNLGARVRVRGQLSAISTCQQGDALQVTEIEVIGQSK